MFCDCETPSNQNPKKESKYENPAYNKQTHVHLWFLRFCLLRAQQLIKSMHLFLFSLSWGNFFWPWWTHFFFCFLSFVLVPNLTPDDINIKTLLWWILMLSIHISPLCMHNENCPLAHYFFLPWPLFGCYTLCPAAVLDVPRGTNSDRIKE